MKVFKIASAVAVVVAAVAGSAFYLVQPKVVAVVDRPGFTATFTSASCKVQPVLDQLQFQAMMARQMGVPEASIQDVFKRFKQGQVIVKEDGKKIKFCYLPSKEDPNSVYVMDELGNEGPMSLKVQPPKL